MWDAVDVCHQFKSCEAEKVASRDKGRHCQIDDIAKEGIFEIVHLGDVGVSINNDLRR